MARFLSLAKAQFHGLIRANRDIFDAVDLTIAGPRIRATLIPRTEPIETRSGYAVHDDAPFYCSESVALRRYYHGYNSPRLIADEIDYENVIYFSTDAFHAADGAGVDFASVRCEVRPHHYSVPSILSEHAEEAVRLFKEAGRLRRLSNNEWENNHSLRLRAVENKNHFVFEQARYFDQVATNLTLDWASGKLGRHRTIRSGPERPEEGKLVDLDQSILANTVGVATAMFDGSFQRIVRLRKSTMGSINKHALHCTVSGVMEPQTSGAGTFGGELLLEAMRCEIGQETGLGADEYQLFPVAFARELARGGKPQFFFAAFSPLRKGAFEARAAEAVERHEFVDLTHEEAQVLAETTRRPSEQFTYEGWAAWLFAEKFLKANEARLKSIINA